MFCGLQSEVRGVVVNKFQIFHFFENYFFNYLIKYSNKNILSHLFKKKLNFINDGPLATEKK